MRNLKQAISFLSICRPCSLSTSSWVLCTRLIRGGPAWQKMGDISIWNQNTTTWTAGSAEHEGAGESWQNGKTCVDVNWPQLTTTLKVNQPPLQSLVRECPPSHGAPVCRCDPAPATHSSSCGGASSDLQPAQILRMTKRLYLQTEISITTCLRIAPIFWISQGLIE